LCKKRKDREDIGVDLYGVQQELARYQMTLEGKHDEFSSVNQQRNQEEQQLFEVRDMYKQTQGHFNSEKKQSKYRWYPVEDCRQMSSTHYVMYGMLFCFGGRPFNYMDGESL
jgi:hypothetical protein